MATRTRHWKNLTLTRPRHSIDADMAELSGVPVCTDVIQHVLSWVDPSTLVRAARTCTAWFVIADKAGVWGAVINARRAAMKWWRADREVYGPTAWRAIWYGFKRGDALPFWDMEFRKLGPGATWRHRLDIVAKHLYMPPRRRYWSEYDVSESEENKRPVRAAVDTASECPLITCAGNSGGPKRRRRQRKNARRKGFGNAYCEQCRLSRRRCKCTCGVCALPAVRCECPEVVAKRGMLAAAAIEYPPKPASDDDIDSSWGSDEDASGSDSDAVIPKPRRCGDDDVDGDKEVLGAVPPQPRRYDALTLQLVAGWNREEAPAVPEENPCTLWWQLLLPRAAVFAPARAAPPPRGKKKIRRRPPPPFRPTRTARAPVRTTGHDFDAAEWGAFREFCWEKGGCATGGGTAAAAVNDGDCDG